MTWRTASRFGLASLILTVVVVADPGWPAVAHDDDGAIMVVDRAIDGLVIDYTVEIRFNDDGHLATDATATVAAELLGAGSTAAAVAMDMTEAGSYVARITLPEPGEWLVRFSSLSPTAYLEVTESVDAAASTTTSTSVSAIQTVVPSSVSTPAGVPSTTAALGEERSGEADRSDTAASVVFFVMTGGMAAVAALLVVTARRRRGGS